MKRCLFFLIFSLINFPLFPLETHIQGKPKKMVRFQEKPDIKEIPARTPEVKAAVEAHSDLIYYLDGGLHAIQNRLRNIVSEIKQGTPDIIPTEILIYALPNGYHSVIPNKCATLLNTLSTNLDDITKNNILISLENYVQKIKDTLNDIVHVSKRFGDPQQPSLYSRFELDLKEKGLNPFAVYETLGFDKDRRFDVEPNDIKDVYNDLEQKYDVLTTAKGRQIFEAYALLNSKFGKELYDEYLFARQIQAPELMDSPLLSKEHIIKLDRDIGFMINELSYYRECLTKLLDKLQANND